MSVRDWFRTRRQLRADLDRQRDLLASKDRRITDLTAETGEMLAVAEQRVATVRRHLAAANRHLIVERAAHVETREQRDEAQARLARLVEELTLLREDIRRAEEIEHPPTTGGAGMVRPLAQRNPMADRILRRPWPDDLTDTIRREAAAKRYEDGLGDPA